MRNHRMHFSLRRPQTLSTVGLIHSGCMIGAEILTGRSSESQGLEANRHCEHRQYVKGDSLSGKILSVHVLYGSVDL